MVEVIKTTYSILRIVNYNENKVKESVAECIAGAGYPLDTDQLSINHKLNSLLHQADLNSNVSRNSMHVSLNFDPSENYSEKSKKEIANSSMEK